MEMTFIAGLLEEKFKEQYIPLRCLCWPYQTKAIETVLTLDGSFWLMPF